MRSAGAGRPSGGRRQDHDGRRRGTTGRAVARAVTLVLAVSLAVVGVAGAANAWKNTISGTVACADAGGWAVTWTVTNPESFDETITASNREAVVPVGTRIEAEQSRTFTENIATRPTAALTLELSAKWDGKDTSTDSGSIPVTAFTDDCAVTTLTAPTVPVVDACGPGNAAYGPVPTGAWTTMTHPDGSLTITADPGFTFPGGQTSITYPVPSDSNVACATPPTTPPVVTPPVVPPEVAPAAVRVVRAAARRIDKCGRQADMFKVAKRSGVVYTAKGKVLREGVWLKARTRSVTVRASAAGSSYQLQGKQVWKMRFTSKACAVAPQVAPATGA